MKKFCTAALVLALFGALLAGCRGTNAPTATHTTKVPATSAATQTTVLPSPDIPLPTDTAAPATTTATTPAARRLG